MRQHAGNRGPPAPKGDMRGPAGICQDTRGHAGTSGDMHGHAGTCGALRGHAGACGDMQRRPGTCGDLREHAGTCGDLRVHAGTCGDMRGHAGTCGDLRGPAGTCGNMRGHAGTCGDMRGHPGTNVFCFLRPVYRTSCVHAWRGHSQPQDATSHASHHACVRMRANVRVVLRLLASQVAWPTHGARPSRLANLCNSPHCLSAPSARPTSRFVHVILALRPGPAGCAYSSSRNATHTKTLVIALFHRTHTRLRTPVSASLSVSASGVYVCKSAINDKARVRSCFRDACIHTGVPPHTRGCSVQCTMRSSQSSSGHPPSPCRSDTATHSEGEGSAGGVGRRRQHPGAPDRT